MSALPISRVRLGSETESIVPLGVFAAADGKGFRCFWSSPEERRTLVGVGIAAEWVGDDGSKLFQEAAGFVSELDFDGDMPVLLGGFAFRCSTDPYSSFVDGMSADNRRVTRSLETPLSNHDSIWCGFPSGRLVLPEVLLSFPAADSVETAEAEPVEAVLAGRNSERLLGNLLSRARKLSEADAANLAAFDLEIADTETSGRKRADQETSAADTSDFRRLLHEAVEAVGSGELEKVVVARQVRHDCSPTPEDVLRRLREGGGRSTVFAFDAAGGAGSGATKSVFAGASPELLASKSGDCFTSLALAGSKPLSEADLLLGDPKELAEHQYVVDHLRSRLADTDAELAATGPPEVLCLAKIAHLASSVSGRTSDGILELVETLHPSPAVAGVPTDAALEFLSQHEQFDRGWYAGPVGWLTPDGDGRFFVALRSVLLNPDECLLFAGSGIVEGSCPEREEQETWLKLQTAMEAILPPSPSDSPFLASSPSLAV